MAETKVESLIIVGSGPAGLTAALYSARARMNPLMIEGEEAGGQLMITSDVENYPGFEHGVTGPDLIATMRKQAERFGTRFITRNVTKVELQSRPFKVYVGQQMYEAQTIIVSTGASAKWIGLPSEKQYMNRGVSACATCDGAFFKDVEVGVVGGGDTAMEEANFLTRYASKVFIIHRSKSFKASKIMLERSQKNPKIEFIMNTVVEEIMGDGKSMNALKLKNTNSGEVIEKKLGGLFVAIGHQPNTKIFNGVLDMNEAGYLKTKPGTTITNIPGVFAAGDVQDPYYRQAITAAGSGCMASLDAERWLEAQEQHG
ncbi:MAG: thioredoxin-disulfide reductase [Bdellovibrionaceae bacterium]|nr:thioredoxin-disulfide reductase [Bdellovibrio sp.]